MRIQEQASGETHLDLIYPLNMLAILYYEQEHYEQAESLFQRVLRIIEQTLGPEHLELARALNNVGSFYID